MRSVICKSNKEDAEFAGKGNLVHSPVTDSDFDARRASDGRSNPGLVWQRTPDRSSCVTRDWSVAHPSAISAENSCCHAR